MNSKAKSTIRLISFNHEKRTQFATEITANVKPTYMHDPAKDETYSKHINNHYNDMYCIYG